MDVDFTNTLRICPVVHHLDDHLFPSRTSANGEFSHCVGYEQRIVRVYPVAHNQYDFFLRANDAIRHVTTDIRERSDDGQRNDPMASHERRGGYPNHGVVLESAQRIVVYLVRQ